MQGSQTLRSLAFAYLRVKAESDDPRAILSIPTWSQRISDQMRREGYDAEQKKAFRSELERLSGLSEPEQSKALGF